MKSFLLNIFLWYNSRLSEELQTTGVPSREKLPKGQTAILIGGPRGHSLAKGGAHPRETQLNGSQTPTNILTRTTKTLGHHSS